MLDLVDRLSTAYFWWIIYAAAKWVGYTWWSYALFRISDWKISNPNLKVDTLTYFVFGTIRLAIGFVFGLALAFGSSPISGQPKELAGPFEDFGLYFIVRIIEWTLILLIASVVAKSGRQFFATNWLRLILWIILGIGISFGIDFARPTSAAEAHFRLCSVDLKAIKRGS